MTDREREQRIDAAILRHMLGEPLEPGDDMILAFTVYAPSCHCHVNYRTVEE